MTYCDFCKREYKNIAKHNKTKKHLKAIELYEDKNKLFCNDDILNIIMGYKEDLEKIECFYYYMDGGAVYIELDYTIECKFTKNGKEHFRLWEKEGEEKEVVIYYSDTRGHYVVKGGVNKHRPIYYTNDEDFIEILKGLHSNLTVKNPFFYYYNPLSQYYPDMSAKRFVIRELKEIATDYYESYCPKTKDFDLEYSFCHLVFDTVEDKAFQLWLLNKSS